ncbi:MAG: hypothetical protein KIT84_20130 [Labilithrix sp.]|nr:hypothetical protein [Labilithrix sp.]MCW5813348.1 hypothetical protein [Labilithrix sp.]
MRARETASNEREAQLLTELSDLVHGVTMPFACGGTLVPSKAVTLHLKNGLEVPIRRAAGERDRDPAVEDLVERCAPAPFGKGKRTLFGRSVRDARQLKAEGGAFSVAGFDPVESGVLESVRREFVPHDPNPLTAELYCLNVYSQGGHFEPHKDTPRGDDMLGTLVVCLPARFRGGQLLVTHRGAPRSFDWARKVEEQLPAPMSAEEIDNPVPDRPAVQHFHGCEYSATGYFGNEGGDTDFYVYAALHVECPPWPKRAARSKAAAREKAPRRAVRATRRAP